MINAIKADRSNLSRLGHVFEHIQVLISGLRWAKIHWVKRSANLVAHSLARYAKNILNDVIWLEDDPPPALEPLFHDCLTIMELKFGSSFKKKIVVLFLSYVRTLSDNIYRKKFLGGLEWKTFEFLFVFLYYYLYIYIYIG